MITVLSVFWLWSGRQHSRRAALLWVDGIPRRRNRWIFNWKLNVPILFLKVHTYSARMLSWTSEDLHISLMWRTNNQWVAQIRPYEYSDLLNLQVPRHTFPMWTHLVQWALDYFLSSPVGPRAAPTVGWMLPGIMTKKKEPRTLTQPPAYFETEYDSILWPPDAKNQLTRNDPDAAQDWRQKEKETAEDGTVR